MNTTSEPLLVPETNILMDIWLERDKNVAQLFLPLAESGTIHLKLPEYALLEFRGTALQWLKASRANLDHMRRPTNQWVGIAELAESADEILLHLRRLDGCLEPLEAGIDQLIERIKAVATVVPHTADIHFRGETRHLEGLPPDHPRQGLEDCRIYEAVLDIAKADAGQRRPFKAFCTKDTDFQVPSLMDELKSYDFDIRRDIGRLYGQIISPNGLNG